MTFPAQSPDLRRFPLVAGASRSVVRSPRSAAPRIRFLFVDSRVRFTLRSAYASRRTPCASLRSLQPGSGRTFTSKSSPMPGPPPGRKPPSQRAPLRRTWTPPLTQEVWCPRNLVNSNGADQVRYRSGPTAAPETRVAPDVKPKGSRKPTEPCLGYMRGIAE